MQFQGIQYIHNKLTVLFFEVIHYYLYVKLPTGLIRVYNKYYTNAKIIYSSIHNSLEATLFSLFLLSLPKIVSYTNQTLENYRYVPIPMKIGSFHLQNLDVARGVCSN